MKVVAALAVVLLELALAVGFVYVLIYALLRSWT